MKHVGCKHLDYEGEYTDCKLIHGPEGWKWWERGETWTTYKGAPKKVQFCKLRGRINEIFACINPGEMGCYEEQEKDNESPQYWPSFYYIHKTVYCFDSQQKTKN